MKKKVLSVIVGLSLIFAIPTYSFATKIPTEPIKPEVQTEESVNEYNKEVDEYNQKVDEYNKEVDDTYTKELENYEVRKEEVTEHNSQEEEKVVENQKQLEKQEKLNQRIENDSQSKLEDSTTDVDGAPTTFDDETVEPKTIKVEKSENPTENNYKIVNLHVFTDMGMEEYYYDTTSISNEGFSLAEELLNRTILLEWETVTVNEKDEVYTFSEEKNYNGSYGLFRRCLEGYTNGYWLGSPVSLSNAINQGSELVDSNWAYLHSYNEGTDYNRPIDNVLIFWIYQFMRYGPEPTKVEKYDPDIWEEPTEPTKLDYLNKLSHLTFTPTEEPIEEPTNPIEPEEPTKPEKEEPTSIPEKTEPIKERTVSQTPARPVHSVITPVMATITAQVNAEPIEVITDTNVPLANTATEEEGDWALINLILMLLTIILYVVLSIIAIKKNRRKLLPQFIGILVAVLSLLIFLMTEDMTLPMILIDQWTIVMFIIFLIEFSLLFIKHKERDKEE